MIYTVTFNPSIDYIVKVHTFTMGTVNRVEEEKYYPGGKGINVSLMLKKLGVESEALGFIAGFTGLEIERMLNKAGCKSSFIKVEEGLSRINVKIKSEEESEVNGRGPRVESKDIANLQQQLHKLKEGDFLVLAGSIPSTLPENIYGSICEELKDKNIKVVVDATGALVLNTLKFNPFLIKPNVLELEEMFHTKLNTHEEIIEKARELQRLGARNVLISMAEQGAIFLSEEGQVLKAKAPKGEVINSVGAGDSMVAGFLAGSLKGGNLEEAFKLSVAAGSASAFSHWLAEEEQVLTLLREIQI